MHPHHARRLTDALMSFPSRRELLRGLAGAGLGIGAMRLPDLALAKKKRKHTKRKPTAKPNAFGCVEVGQACANAGDCCSGICEGKKGKKRCQGRGVGTCDQAADGFCEAGDPQQTACNAVAGCLCLRTTGGSQFCGDLNGESGSSCASCRKDADCEALGFPAGSACVPMGGKNSSSSPCGTACLVPCGATPP